MGSSSFRVRARSQKTVGDPKAAYTALTVGSFGASFIVVNARSKRVMRDCDSAKGWAMAVRCVTEVGP